MNKVLHLNDLVACENVFFAATGVTDGDWLKGVRYEGNVVHIIARHEAKSGTIRYIDAIHNIQKLDEISGINTAHSRTEYLSSKSRNSAEKFNIQAALHSGAALFILIRTFLER